MEIGETDDILNVQEIMRLVQISDKNSLKPSFKNSKLEFSKNDSKNDLKNGSKNDSKNDSKYNSKPTSETSTDFNNKTSNWNNLPPELLISILLKLPIQDVYRTASTNKNWYSIFAQNNYLWKNLFYREFGRPDPNPVQNSYNPFNSLNLEGQSENSAENNINNDSFSSIPENVSVNSSETPTTTLPTVTTLPTSTSNTLEKHQRLLINVRDWSLTDEEIETLNDPDENSPFDPASPPALSKFPRLIIFDLNLWTPIRELTGHEALSPANRCCFLMPSASGRFAACGDETGKVYIWEYSVSGGCEVPHGPLYHQGITNVQRGYLGLPIPSNVNCVAFHPKDDSMLVTAGDDGRVRVFKSNGYARILGRPGLRRTASQNRVRNKSKTVSGQGV